MFTGPRRHLDGPPFALPRPLDTVAERWWRARPRTRALLGLAGAAIVVVAGVAHAGASPHGPPTDVWIASRDLAVGQLLGRDDVRRTAWPRDLVPDGALREPAGTVRAPLPRGAVITDRHLGDAGLTARLPAGAAAVAIPHDTLPSLPPGTHADLVGHDLDGRAVTLASRAVVLAVDDDAVWVAVDHDVAARVAGAAATGAMAVVVVPP